MLYVILTTALLIISSGACFTWGFLLGYRYKVVKQTKDTTIKETIHQLEKDVLQTSTPGEIIEINVVGNYLKENINKEMSIGEILDNN